jgi:Ca2+-binding RTX toxin-like protein
MTLFGTYYRDVIFGTIFGDEIRGYGGPDDLYGGFGNDFIYGGQGHDRITGSVSDFYFQDRPRTEQDYLIGGRGRDTFVLTNSYWGGGDNDFAILADFDPQYDKIELNRGLIYSISTVNGVCEIRLAADELVAKIPGLQVSTGLLGYNGSWTIQNPSWVVFS